jgi:hypothetical protein
MNFENTINRWEFSAGSVNSASNPQASLLDRSRDTETAVDPAWRGNNTGDHLSTAHIRNAPMKGLWELGFIHRGYPWRTIKLTGASDFVTYSAAATTINNINASTYSAFAPSATQSWNYTSGTDYRVGDGGILDAVKLTPQCYSWGKLDINLLASSKLNASNSVFSSTMQALNEDMIKALFINIRRDQLAEDFIRESTAGSTSKGSKWPSSMPATGSLIGSGDITSAIINAFASAADFGTNGAFLRSEFLNTAYGAGDMSATSSDRSDFTFGLAAAEDDAAQEELIGKTIALLGANEAAVPNVFKVLAIAQAVEDIGGTSSSVAISKVDDNGNTHTRNCLVGQFDYITNAVREDGGNYNLYFDRITGEVKIIATIERNPFTGKMKIMHMEYID